MRKVILMLFCLIFLSSLLFGCQPTDTVGNPTARTDNAEKMSIVRDFITVSVSKAKGVDEVTFDDKKSIDVFRSIFSSAVKEAGVVNMAAPDFYLEVGFNEEKQQNLYVWIGEKGQRSTFMKTEDTNIIYTVTAEKTEQLINLVESRFY